MSQHNHQHWKRAINPTIGKMLKNSKTKPLATRKPLKIINTTVKHKRVFTKYYVSRNIKMCGSI